MGVLLAARYQEIADDLRQAIMTGGEFAGGTLAADAQLPTEPQLMEHYGASRTTIRNALRVLTAEGLLETRGRAGTYVRRLPLMAHPGDTGTAPVFRTFAAQVRAGHEPSEEFSFRIEPATSTVAGRLRIEVDDLVAVRTTLRYIDGIPWGQQTFHFPLRIAEAAGLTAPRSIERGSLRALADAGYTETGVETRIWARPATRDEAETFGLGQGVYVLHHERTGYSHGQPVRVGTEVLPADRNLIVETTGEVPEEGK